MNRHSDLLRLLAMALERWPESNPQLEAREKETTLETNGGSWSKYRFLLEIIFLLVGLGAAWQGVKGELKTISDQHAALIVSVEKTSGAVEDIKEELHRRDLEELKTIDRLEQELQYTEDMALSPTERSFIRQRNKQ